MQSWISSWPVEILVGFLLARAANALALSHDSLETDSPLSRAGRLWFATVTGVLVVGLAILASTGMSFLFLCLGAIAFAILVLVSVIRRERAAGNTRQVSP